MQRKRSGTLLCLLALALVVPAAAPALSAREALHDPDRLLRLFVAPPGSRVITIKFGVGPRLLREPGSGLAFPSLATHRIWRVPLPFARAFDFVRTHRRAHVLAYPAQTDKSLRAANRELIWKFHRIPKLIADRWLSITLVALSRRSTAIRVDAADSWSVRPPNEKVPAGVRTITISRTRYEKTPALSFSVTDPAKVARIVHLLDLQPIATPDVFRDGCPLQPPGPTLEFDFRAANGRIVAHAQPAGCGTLSFFAHRHEETPLRGNFVTTVQRLLGVEL